jgi:hypothetical protein
MQQRIADIIEGAKQKAVAANGVIREAPAPAPQPPAPIQKVPNLMDHTIALRQEVADMRNELAFCTQRIEALGQVTEAVGNAVGQLYATFQQQTVPTDQGATYSENFQHQVEDGDY